MASLGIAAGHELGRDAARGFERLAGVCAESVAVIGLIYSLSFVVLRNDVLTALTLLLNGLLTSLVIIALYEQLQGAGAPARWALALGLVGAFGATIHGGYDLANAVHPPATLNPDLPHAVDPRGLLTFGVAGLAVGAFAWLLAHHAGFPRGLAWLGAAFAALLVAIYLARLLVLSPTQPLLLLPVLLTGFVVHPLWYGWLGLTFWQQAGKSR